MNNARLRCMTWLCMLMAALVAVGCGGTWRYDVSREAPFGHYANKEVPLTRPVLLINTSTPDLPQLYCILVDPTLPNSPLESDKWDLYRSRWRVLELPAGSLVHVGDTVMTHSIVPLWGTDRWHIGTTVAVVGVHAEGWPNTIAASFNNAAIPWNSWLEPGWGDFEGKIRAAPWEPLDTPASRPFAKPR